MNRIQYAKKIKHDVAKLLNVPVDDVDVVISPKSGTWEPTITYYDAEAVATFRGTWREGESFEDIDWID